MPIHLLIVEDDPLVRYTLAAGLRQGGFGISEASSVEEALAALADIRPDLAILDMRLPDGSGADIAARLQDRFDVPFLFLSAFDDASLVGEVVRLGALGYLVKPLEVAQIVPSVHAALARAEEIRGLRKAEESLSAALKNSREISMAIGLLMERHKISAEDAFNRLRGHARSLRQKVVQVAEALIGDPTLLDWPPGR